jgi:LPXTG-motif cell wall-anchored protein
MLEGLTAGTARTYAVVLIGVIPALVALFGILYLARRKNR